MEKHEMMSLEDSGQLRDKIRFFEQELLKNHHIDPNLYVEYNVKRGLRDSAGKGVLTGLTEISDVNGYNLINGRQIPADGRLYYQGINVQDIISGLNGRRFGFEETIYLLIFGKLPDKEELSRFLDMMSDMEELGGRFVRDVVMKGTNANHNKICAVDHGSGSIKGFTVSINTDFHGRTSHMRKPSDENDGIVHSGSGLEIHIVYCNSYHIHFRMTLGNNTCCFINPCKQLSAKQITCGIQTLWH